MAFFVLASVAPNVLAERTLRRHNANVWILSGMDDHLVQHSLGDISGKCVSGAKAALHV